MKKTIPLITALFFVSATPISAKSLFTVTPNGEVQRSVLGESIGLGGAVEKVSRNVATAAIDSVKEIAIEEIENKTHIKIESIGNTEEQVLGEELKELITIEGDIQSDKVSIHKEDQGFSIMQNGIKATTDLPVTIVPSTHEVFIETSNGKVKLSILPADALRSIVKANVINIIPEDGKIRLEQKEDTLQYSIIGEKLVSIFNITRVIAPVESTVSATDGVVAVTKQPQWLDLLGFILK